MCTQHWLHSSYKQGTTDHPRRLQAIQPIGAWYTGRIHRGHWIQRRLQPALYPSLVSLKSLCMHLLPRVTGIKSTVVIMVCKGYRDNFATLSGLFSKCAFWSQQILDNLRVIYFFTRVISAHPAAGWSSASVCITFATTYDCNNNSRQRDHRFNTQKNKGMNLSRQRISTT